MSDGKVIYEVRADDSKVNNDLDQANRKVEQGSHKIGSAAKGIAVAVGAAVATMAAAAGAAAVSFAKKGVEIASDLEEVQNVVDVAFGNSADAINDWAKTATNAYGLSELSAKRWTGTMGAMLKSMQVSDDMTLQMSTDLAGLAGDFASFYNLDHEEAWTKIRSGIAGETEPLKQLGINMSVTNLEAFALKEGIKKTYSEMSQSEQTILRYNYLMSVTADAQGDFARTSGSWANQLRTAKLNIENMSASIGKQLLPSLTNVLQTFNKVAEESGGDARLFIANLDKVVEAGAQAAKEMLPLITSLMRDILNGIVSVLPEILDAGGEIILSLADGIIDALPTIANAMGQLVAKLAESVPAIVNSLLSAIPNILTGFVNGLFGIEDRLTEFKQKYDSAIESLASAKSVYEDTTTAAEGTAIASKKLADELYRLVDKENKTSAEKERILTLVNLLNEAIPELNLHYDEQADALDRSYESTNNLIESQLKLAKVEGAKKYLSDLGNKLYEAEKAANELGDGIVETANKLLSTNFKSDEIEKAANALKSVYDLTPLLKTEYNKSETEKAIDSYLNYANAIKEYEQEYADALEYISQNSKENIEESAKATDEFTKERFAAVEEWNAKIEEAEKKHNDAMGTIYDEGLKKQKISLDKATDNLENQVEETEEYRENLRVVMSKIPEDVYEYLKGLGAEAADLVAEMTTASEPKLQAFVDAVRAKSAQAREMAVEEVGQIPGQMSDALNNVEGVKASAEALGKDIGAGVDRGIQKRIWKIVKTVQNMVKNIIDSARRFADSHSPSRRMEREFGITIPQGAAVGIEKETPKAVKAAEKMVDEIANVATVEKSLSRTLTTAGAAHYQSNTYYQPTHAQYTGPMLNIEKNYMGNGQDVRRVGYDLEIARRDAAMAIGAKP